MVSDRQCKDLFFACVIVMYAGWMKFTFDGNAVYVLDYLFRIVCIALIFRIYLWPEVMVKPKSLFAAVGFTILVFYLMIVTKQATQWSYFFYEDYRFGWFPKLPIGLFKYFDLTIGLALVALSEELVFRFQFADHWRRKGGSVRSLYWVSSSVFALLHFPQGMNSTISAFVAGFLFMFLYRRTGSLWPPVIVHYVFNLIIFSGAGCDFGMGGCRLD